MKPILLDTCAVIWLLGQDGLSEKARFEFEQADAAGAGIYVSPISAWEIGMLAAKGRIALPTTPKTWFAELLAIGVRLASLTPDILIDASSLPGSLHKDPADRIIASTARTLGYRLMTSDRPLLAYAEAGHLQVIAC